jgi:hypothetical protein
VRSRQSGAGRRMFIKLAQPSMGRWSVGLGVIGLALSGLFGGLEPASAPTVPTVAVDTAIEAGPWRVTVTGARLAGDLPPLLLQDKADHWVVAVATVEITADETETDLRQILRLSGVDGLKTEAPSNMVMLRDSTVVKQLNPGMPEKLLFLWEQSSGARVPTEITVRVQGLTWRPDSLTGRNDWKDPKTCATVSVPVQDRRGTA